MIFVTVGTHEQQFNRLVEYMDNWAAQNDEDVVIQTGYSTYEPQNCIWKRFFSYQEMSEKVADARIVITHGGPSSFIMPLQIGKKPIVVPRSKKFEEHVNDHQVEFCRQVESRMGLIIVVNDIIKLNDAIKNYNNITNSRENNIMNNNARFCNGFANIVDDMF